MGGRVVPYRPGATGGKASQAAACGPPVAPSRARAPPSPTCLPHPTVCLRSVAELEAEMRRVGLLGGPFFPFASLAAAGPPGPQAALRSLVSHSSYLAAAVSFAGGQGQGTPESLLNVTYMRGRRDRCACGGVMTCSHLVAFPVGQPRRAAAGGQCMAARGSTLSSSLLLPAPANPRSTLPLSPCSASACQLQAALVLLAAPHLGRGLAALQGCAGCGGRCVHGKACWAHGACRVLAFLRAVVECGWLPTWLRSRPAVAPAPGRPPPAHARPPAARPQSAVARVAPGATAFPWRTAQWCSQVFAGWKKPEDREAKLASVERVRLVAQQIFTNHAYGEAAGSSCLLCAVGLRSAGLGGAGRGAGMRPCHARSSAARRASSCCWRQHPAAQAANKLKPPPPQPPPPPPVNYIEGSVPVEAYYGSNMGWLRRLKAQIDPACYWWAAAGCRGRGWVAAAGRAEPERALLVGARGWRRRWGGAGVARAAR